MYLILFYFTPFELKSDKCILMILSKLCIHISHTGWNEKTRLCKVILLQALDWIMKKFHKLLVCTVILLQASDWVMKKIRKLLVCTVILLQTSDWIMKKFHKLLLCTVILLQASDWIMRKFHKLLGHIGLMNLTYI